MKFSFGQYKGREIADVATYDIGYIHWVLQNCMNINDEEYMEARRIFNTSPEFIVTKCKQEKALASFEQFESEYLHRYLYNGKNYCYIKRVTQDPFSTDNPGSDRAYSLVVFDAIHHNKRVCLQDDAINMTHILRNKLIDNYSFVTQEEFENNLNMAIEIIRNSFGG